MGYAERRPAGPEYGKDAPAPDDIPLSAARALKAELHANDHTLTAARIRQILRDHDCELPDGPLGIARAVAYAGALEL